VNLAVVPFLPCLIGNPKTLSTGLRLRCHALASIPGALCCGGEDFFREFRLQLGLVLGLVAMSNIWNHAMKKLLEAGKLRSRREFLKMAARKSLTPVIVVYTIQKSTPKLFAREPQ